MGGRKRGAEVRPSDQEGGVRFCYADPPYIGQAKRHYGKEAAAAGRVASEVDHLALVASLMEYDGWALSASSPSILGPGGLAAMMPEGTRMGAWVKPFASFKKGVAVAYCWEPVFFKSCRKWSADIPTVRDYVSANITLQRGVSGAKPDAFNYWLFEVLGMSRDDEFVDLFPGSGAVSRAWDQWRNQEAIA
jgi:hypothetical protein